ncbi:hypothetical protein [Agrobacterium rubi]|uniref:hypothetical protein n=1 Tax=Agrobacterium rubi TaxID=28099 RepID=UPI001571A368|nr:hypothetical protein [Agrobacterium rubi]NTE87218.1 hypothetical protein [Agrobacterium rubi]NTF03152.1 hypothetical protein [Agrobacterium rubi]
MMDIRQEELDKRYVDGVLAVESLLYSMKLLSGDQVNSFAGKVHGLIVDELGEERYAAIAGAEEVHT